MNAIESKGPKTKILIVDDELIVAVNIKHILIKYGYEVVDVVGSVDEALESVKSKSPHLILMDINLKDRVDGITLAKMILEFADVSIIFLTAYSDLTTISRAKEIGSYGYIIKPFESKDLYAAIEMAIYKHSMEKNLQESEERWQFALEGSGDGVWDWNLETNEVFYSKKWKEMLGYREDEIENNLNEWESRVHPDDLKTTLEKINLHLQGKEPLYIS